MLKKISDDYIINVLQNHEALMKAARQQLVDIFKSKDENGMIVCASLYKEDSGSSRTNDVHDLSDVLDRYNRLCHEWTMSVQSNVRSLIERQETINRIMACYNNLSFDYQHVLNMLYINNSYKEGLSELINEYKKGRTTILRMRKSAIEAIKEMYNSELTNLELYRKFNKYR